MLRLQCGQFESVQDSCVHYVHSIKQLMEKPSVELWDAMYHLFSCGLAKYSGWVWWTQFSSPVKFQSTRIGIGFRTWLSRITDPSCIVGGLGFGNGSRQCTSIACTGLRLGSQLVYVRIGCTTSSTKWQLEDITPVSNSICCKSFFCCLRVCLPSAWLLRFPYYSMSRRKFQRMQLDRVCLRVRYIYIERDIENN